MSNSALIGLAPRVQTVGMRDPHRAGRYKGPLVGHSTYPGGLELSTRCTGSSRGLGVVAFVHLIGGFGLRSFFLLAWVLSVWCVLGLHVVGAGTSGATSCSWRTQLQRLEGTKDPSWGTVHLQRCFLVYHRQFIAC